MPGNPRPLPAVRRGAACVGEPRGLFDPRRDAQGREGHARCPGKRNACRYCRTGGPQGAARIRCRYQDMVRPADRGAPAAASRPFESACDMISTLAAEAPPLVLIVDDDEDVRTAIGERLHPVGMEAGI